MIINFNLMSPKKIFIFSLLATIVVGFLFFTGTVLAQADPYGLFATADKAGLTNTGSADLPTLAGNVLGTALSFIGVLFFALMVFGGFMWMTARGNEEQTKKALSTITAAVIGLIIVLSSYTITNFVFKSVGIQSTPSGVATTGQTQSTVGTDTWCGRTDVELLSTFEIPSGWTDYKCIDVVVSADEEASYCKDGKLYASADVNKCPGSQKCCDSTKVPEGYGKFCLVKAEVDQTPTCEKIGLDFNQEKVCVGKYDTETACKTAIKDGVGTSKAAGTKCVESSECESGLSCVYTATADGKNQSTDKSCMKKYNSDAGPCVDSANDCSVETDKCITSDSAVNYKVCGQLKISGKCQEASDCAQGYECKNLVCTIKSGCSSNSDCPTTAPFCAQGNSGNIAFDKFECRTGSGGAVCDDDADCLPDFWCKEASIGQDTCASKLVEGTSCERDRQCKVRCASGKCFGS